MISWWRTNAESEGSSGPDQIRLPLTATGTYHFTVAWGDGASTTVDSDDLDFDHSAVEHAYLSPGEKTVSITGIVEGWRFNDAGKAHVQRVQPRMRTTTNDSAIAAAAAGLGLARLLSYQVAAQVRSGALQPVLEAFESAPLPVHVVHHEGRRATQKVRAFIDLAVERLRGDPSLA